MYAWPCVPRSWLSTSYAGAISLFGVGSACSMCCSRSWGAVGSEPLVAAVGAVGLFPSLVRPPGELTFIARPVVQPVYRLFHPDQSALVWNGPHPSAQPGRVVLVYVMLLVVFGSVYYGDEPAGCCRVSQPFFTTPRPKINGWKSCCRICRRTKCWSTTGRRIGPFTKE